MTEPQKRWLALGGIVVITIASIIGINQYHYGMWNQWIAIPWLNDFINPELFPNDPLIAQRENSPSFYNSILKSLAPIFNGDIPLMHFVLFSIVHFLTFISFYTLSRQFFQERRSAFFSLLVLSFSFPVIGSVAIWDTVLMERTIALPILMFSMLFLIQRKWLWAVVLQALAFNLHPLSGIYFIACSWLGVLFSEGFKWKTIRFWPLLLVLMVPVLYLKWSHPSDSSAIAVSDQWMKIMHLRNAHHTFPSAFPLEYFIKAGLVMITYFILIARSGFDRFLKGWLNGFGAGVMLFILIGTVFTEWIPIRIIIQIQFYRSFMFMVILTLIMWSGLILQKDDRVVQLLSIPILLQYFYGEWTKAAGVLITLVAAYLLLKGQKNIKWQRIIPIAVIYLALGIAGYIQRGGFEIRSGLQDDNWYEVQDWANSNSPEDAVFIVPPAMKGFRVKSNRSCYGDWYDGTKTFFSEDYSKTWWHRMESLGCTDPDNLDVQYANNTARDFQSIWETQLQNDYKVAYVVTYGDMNLDDLELIFENQAFKVYKL